MAYLYSPATNTLALNPSASSLNYSTQQFFKLRSSTGIFPKSNNKSKQISRNSRINEAPFSFQCTKFSTPTFVSEKESDYESEEDSNSKEEYEEEDEGEATTTVGNEQQPPPLQRRRRRYRREYPGEKKGIAEEMRFVAMKLRKNGKTKTKKCSAIDAEKGDDDSEENSDDGNRETWQPSMEGFLKYLVDSELVFSTVERIVDESTDVSYVHFRKTGVERSGCISKDLEWLREQGNVIPQASNPGLSYVKYLEELAEKSPPLFLCHLYNIYFSHIAGGQVIAKQVSNKILGGKELEFYKWEEGNGEELLRGVREKLNALSQHWSRDEKNKCLKETTKAFRSLGQIVRLIIL